MVVRFAGWLAPDGALFEDAGASDLSRARASCSNRRALQENADTRAGERGSGTSLVRRPPYCCPLSVPSPRSPGALPPGRAIYLAP
jgi:hypothetical protein